MFNLGPRVLPYVFDNTDSILDIPTSTMITGARGETIFNGGHGRISAIIGGGNNWKSTLGNFLNTAAANTYMASNPKDPAYIANYDTEINVSLDRLENLTTEMEYLPDNPITGHNAIWSVTDKSGVSGDVWVENFSAYCKEKAKSKKRITWTAIQDPYTKKPLETLPRTYAGIDSFSELDTQTSNDKLTKNLDDSSTNTYALDQGRFKAKFITQLPTLSGKSNTSMFVTLHIGPIIDLTTGPAKYTKPTKHLQFLKKGDMIKGGTNKVNYLLNGGGWFAHNATAYVNSGTKLPEYPLTKDDSDPTELNKVRLQQLRGKNGTSGYVISILMSQYTGVCNHLTFFDHIKECGRFGIVGSLTSYELVFLPGVKISRTTVRGKLLENKELRRAVQLTSNLLQLFEHKPVLKADGLLCSPQELYDDIKELGYDWGEILKTRGFHTHNQYAKHLPHYLSIVDIVKMRAGLYIPYWLDKKTREVVEKRLKERRDGT